MKSTYKFDRWEPREQSTWVFRVFKKHNIELLKMYTAFETARTYTYKNLGKVASWTDLPSAHFTFKPPLRYDQFEDLRAWSNGINELENWINLNTLVAISSNLETYLATAVPLALSSDIGTMYGASRKIDGVQILKHGRLQALEFGDEVLGVTKGTWSGRLAAYEKLFGRSPKIFSSNIASLDKIRILRNNVAHSFGRDIEASRNQQEVRTLPIEKLNRDTLLSLQRMVWLVTKAIDVHLHKFHIGEYQSLVFYHDLYQTLRKDIHPSERAMILKKRIGGFGATPAGKEFCKGLVLYYEAL